MWHIWKALKAFFKVVYRDRMYLVWFRSKMAAKSEKRKTCDLCLKTTESRFECVKLWKTSNVNNSSSINARDLRPSLKSVSGHSLSFSKKRVRVGVRLGIEMIHERESEKLSLSPMLKHMKWWKTTKSKLTYIGKFSKCYNSVDI